MKNSLVFLMRSGIYNPVMCLVLRGIVMVSIDGISCHTSHQPKSFLNQAIFLHFAENLVDLTI